MEVLVMSGAGNDFCVLDARGKTLDLEALAKTLCARFGTDGLLALDASEEADFRLHFYNSDGTRGEMCGNGARCVCRYAYAHGIAGGQMTVQTDAGRVYGWRQSESSYRVRLNTPGLVDLQRHPNAAYVELGNPGIPHSVTECEALDWNSKGALLPEFLQIFKSPVFPKGVNVNFYRWLAPDTVQLLTYERGVDGFTLACGTGSASTAVVLWLQGKLPGGHLIAKNPGGDLQIAIEGSGAAVTALYLEGPTEILGTYEI